MQQNAENTECVQPKRSRELWLRAGKILLFTVLVIGMLYGLQAWLYPEGTRVNKIIGRIHKLDEGADLALFGTSTCYCNFVPKYYNEITGEYSLQLGTAGQKMPESLALLKEQINQGTPPKTALLYFGVTSRLSVYHTRGSVTVLENLPLCRNKVELFFNLHYNTEELPDALFKAYRAREFLEERLNTLFTSKAKAESTSTYTLPENYRKYIGAGYSGSQKAYESGHVCITESYGMNEESITPGVMALVDEFVELCKENNIRLIIVLPPRLPASILLCDSSAKRDYSYMHEYYQKMADGYGVMLWDFNYIYPEILTYQPEQFRDTHHSNHTLAFQLTEVIAEMVQKVENGSFSLEDYFYDSYDEYLKIYSGIQGIKLSIDKKHLKNGNINRAISFALGADTQAEWRVSFGDSKEGPFKLGQDWNQGNRVLLNGSVTGKYMKIEARQPGSEVIEQSVVVKNIY